MAMKPKDKSKAKETDERIVVIKDVRLSFPHLFKPQERQNDDGNTRENYNAVFMIPKDHPKIEEILRKMKRASMTAKKRAYGDDESKWPKIPQSMTCFKDGDNEDHFTTPRAEYEGHYILSAASPVDRPPKIITNRKDSDNLWIEAEPGKKGAPYAGCYVNAIIEVYAQKKDSKRQMPNRINASIQTVQFRRDGEPFQQQPIDPNDLLDEDDVSYEGELGDEDDGDDDSSLI